MAFCLRLSSTGERGLSSSCVQGLDRPSGPDPGLVVAGGHQPLIHSSRRGRRLSRARPGQASPLVEQSMPSRREPFRCRPPRQDGDIRCGLRRPWTGPPLSPVETRPAVLRWKKKKQAEGTNHRQPSQRQPVEVGAVCSERRSRASLAARATLELTLVSFSPFHPGKQATKQASSKRRPLSRDATEAATAPPPSSVDVVDPPHIGPLADGDAAAYPHHDHGPSSSGETRPGKPASVEPCKGEQHLGRAEGASGEQGTGGRTHGGRGPTMAWPGPLTYGQLHACVCMGARLENFKLRQAAQAGCCCWLGPPRRRPPPGRPRRWLAGCLLPGSTFLWPRPAWPAQAAGCLPPLLLRPSNPNPGPSTSPACPTCSRLAPLVLVLVLILPPTSETTTKQASCYDHDPSPFPTYTANRPSSLSTCCSLARAPHPPSTTSSFPPHFRPTAAARGHDYAAIAQPDPDRPPSPRHPPKPPLPVRRQLPPPTCDLRLTLVAQPDNLCPPHILALTTQTETRSSPLLPRHRAPDEP
ncbi:uncharacterized protein PSFLO_05031 [Pseudozyma flocculosa]|uniref:Uncharacterized protein n=1 Tax=Pseudozyma flocculosa TaxID=84751 RepID=A0A5C3F5Z2_9BASI|nr:uncharacterized protein PSFLO_05031 [Pseudozyma flocculosa]